MKKLVSMLLVLSMVLALAGTAMAACEFVKGDWVVFKCDSNSYDAARASKQTKNVVQKGSQAQVKCVSGKYVKLRVNEASKIDKWFKACDLKLANADQLFTRVVWAKGGKGMSFKKHGTKVYEPYFKGKKVAVTGHTNLRKTPSLHKKSQGVVEADTLLKLTGWYQLDNRLVAWWEVSYKCKKLWVSENFIALNDDGVPDA